MLSRAVAGGDGDLGRWGDGEMGRWGDMPPQLLGIIVFTS